MKYASIIPLIGGETLGMQAAFKQRPEYLLSYETFKSNDSHLVNYYNNEVPYILLDNRPKLPIQKVDIVNTVCPCAGLSSLSPSASEDNSTNDWLYLSSEYILSEVKPQVFWGENAPRLASNSGAKVANRLRAIGKKYGYGFSLYKTKSLLHGSPQVRDRSFYFFWKGNKVPVLNFYRREYKPIEQVIIDAKRYHNDEMYNTITNKKIPSQDPYYQYLLHKEKKTHAQYANSINKSKNVLMAAEEHEDYKGIGKWMKDHGYDKEAASCDRKYKKLNEGFSVMRKHIEIPKGYIGAFVGHLPKMIAHPTEDRFLNVRECLEIMSMPSDFNLVGGIKNLNHICQNVPVITATDIANEVKAVLEGKRKILDVDFLVQDNKKATTNNQGVLC